MARFEFRLKTLLTLREASRDERRRELAGSHDALCELQRQHQSLQMQWEQQRQTSRAHVASATIDPQRLMADHRYENELRNQLDALAERERQLLAEMDRQREQLLAADREMRTLEKLRARQLDEFHRNQARAETKTLDEMASHPAFSPTRSTPGGV
jgi:flagellar protein FliJ